MAVGVITPFAMQGTLLRAVETAIFWPAFGAPQSSVLRLENLVENVGAQRSLLNDGFWALKGPPTFRGPSALSLIWGVCLTYPQGCQVPKYRVCKVSMLGIELWSWVDAFWGC